MCRTRSVRTTKAAWNWVSAIVHQNSDLDPIFESDRNSGSTLPETGEQSSNIVGRPTDAAEHAVGFHEHSETVAQEREAFSGEEALLEGGSFDGLGLPVADDRDSVLAERPE
jgi:hypothetical protein